jgi:membrane protease YdiL (CAAX protease family)
MLYLIVVFLLILALYLVPREAFKSAKGTTITFIILYSLVYLMLMHPRLIFPQPNPIGLIFGLCLFVLGMKLLFDKPISFGFLSKGLLIIIFPVLMVYFTPAKNSFTICDCFVFIFVVHYIAVRYLTLPIVTYKNLFFKFDVIYKTILLTLLIVFRTFRRIDFGFQLSFNLIDSAITIIATVALAVICSIVALQLKYLKLKTPEVKLKEMFTITVLMFLFVALPEEFIFRGLIYNYLSQYLGHWGPIIPLLASSIIFGIVHLRFGWKMALLATVAGCFYCFVYWETGNIFYAAVIHTLTNLFQKYGLTVIKIPREVDIKC